jgi:hypothetical protein
MLEQTRQEAMHMIEAWQAQKGSAAKELQATARIRRVISENATAHRIRDPRGEPFAPAVTPLPAPADNQAGAIRRPGHTPSMPQAHDIGWIILPIAIERRYPRRLCRQDAGQNCRTLSGVACMPPNTYGRISVGKPKQFRPGAVSTAVIDTNDFAGEALGQTGLNLFDKWTDTVLLVQDRNDNR